MGTIQQKEEVRTSRVAGVMPFPAITLPHVDAQRLLVLSNFGEGLQLCTWPDGAVTWSRKGAARNAFNGIDAFGGKPGYQSFVKPDRREY